jgi:ferritin-like metal-binding protein YciE
MAMKTQEDLFLHLLQDIYYAEKQILKALPKMAKAVDGTELATLFREHEEETEGQVERLKKVFELGDKRARGVKCQAILGLIEESEDVMDDASDDEVLAIGLTAGAQAVEHYEIARYGTLVQWAKELGYDESVPLLQQNLDEEKNADKKLNELALKSAKQKKKAA